MFSPSLFLWSLDQSSLLHVLLPRSPAGPPILIRRSRASASIVELNYYASIVNTSCFIFDELIAEIRKRRGKAEIRTADLHIHDLENVSALDRSTTVGRLQSIEV